MDSFLDFLKFLLFGPDDPYQHQAFIGALIGAAVAIGGGIISSRASKKAAERQQAELDKQKREERNWYDRRYNEDYTQTATAQSLLTKARQFADDSYKRAAGAAKVGGASTESAALAKQAGNKVIADVAGNIAAQGDARRDALDMQHMQNQKEFANQQMQVYQQQAAASQAAGNGIMSAGMGVLGADLQSHLNDGRGLFENLFNKNMPPASGGAPVTTAPPVSGPQLYYHNGWGYA